MRVRNFISTRALVEAVVRISANFTPNTLPHHKVYGEVKCERLVLISGLGKRLKVDEKVKGRVRHMIMINI